MSETWRRCSSCKKEIGFKELYWVCSVSTCTRPRVGFFFCSVSCWEAHLPSMRHREAWAVEKVAPSKEQWEREQAEGGDEAEGGDDDRADAASPPPVRRAVTPSPSPAPASASASAGASSSSSSSGGGAGAVRRVVGAQESAESDEDLPKDILIVASKLKKYIKARSGMNTSDNVMAVLSDYVRKVCDLAIRNAAQEGRKTVLDRDVTPFSR